MKFPADCLARTATCCAALFMLMLADIPPAMTAPSDCARIEADAERLACFDREFPPETLQQPDSDLGAWVVQATPSALPGHQNAIVSRASESDIQCRWTPPRPIQLNLQCKDNVTSVSFETGCYMTSSQYRSYGYVTYQLDKDSPRVAHMVAGPDNHSLGFWSGDAAIPFIRELLGKGRVSVKMTPYAEDPVSTTFDLRGMEEAIKPLRKECGW